ncbi:MAG: 2-succinyl-5-enolpyruvyl-6-hydroxy-3-cyclohexene-1-carboxylic-acid synthase [Acidimicrobiales bacterium]
MDGVYELCHQFLAELGAHGVTDVVISPGSRSTPLALAAEASACRTTIHHDERVAGFFALGMAKQTRRPTVLICTSGTAGANYYPAVIEAHLSRTPLIICTADRPPELRQWGAGQTVDQLGMFGRNVSWFYEMPVAGEISPRFGSSVGLRAHEMSENGPVHLNWPFREPLEPTGAPPAVEARTTGTARRVAAPSERLIELPGSYERGLIVVGPADLDQQAARELADFAETAGWPLLADAGSGLRTNIESPNIVTTFELLLGGDRFTQAIGTPEVIIRVGPSPTSKAYRLWVEAVGCDHLLLVDPGPEWGDPTGTVTEVIPGPITGLFKPHRPASGRASAWLDLWVEAQRSATKAIENFLENDPGELGLGAELVRHLGTSTEAASLMLSNSMPVRDVELVMTPTPARVRVLTNRGASGIDGILSTGAGIAAGSGAPTWVLLGDVAALHDLGGMAAIPRLGLTNFTAVVVDNDGGGIFSMLPIKAAVASETFERVFTTPHQTPIAATARALGWRVTEAESRAEFAAALADGDDPEHAGPAMIVVQTTIDEMTAGVAALRVTVADALA